ncbi:MAG TPA: hypothetical protein VGJ42_04340 [Nitrososphaera sp.]|jgi:hypothetical protein
MITVKVKNAKSYRERRKLARAARNGSIEGGGRYGEKRRDHPRERSET